MQRKMIDIEGLNKAEVLAELYNNSKIQGMGFFGQLALGDKAGSRMSTEEAQQEIDKLKKFSRDLYFDYLHGKVMKVDLSSNKLDPWGYDRDNGSGAAERVVEHIRNKSNRLYQIGENVEALLAEKKHLDQVNEDLKQNPETVVNNANNSFKIFVLPTPMTSLGRENELRDKNLSKINVDISYNGKVLSFPKLKAGEKLVCAYNQWGMQGMAKMFECHSVANMQELYDGYSRGGALTIDWYIMTEKKLENTIQFSLK